MKEYKSLPREMHIDPDSLSNGRLVISPEDWIGVTFSDERQVYNVKRILRRTSTNVTFAVLNENTGKLQELMMGLENFDPEFALQQEMNRLARSRAHPDQILEVCERILLLNPRSEPAAFNKGVFLRRKGHFVDALAAFELAVSLNPEDVTNLLHKSLNLVDLERYREAVEVAIVAVDCDCHQFANSLQEMKFTVPALRKAVNALLVTQVDHDKANRLDSILRQVEET